MNKKIFIHISLQEKILFTKNLALTLKSGVSLVKSLELLMRQAKTRSLKRVLSSLLDDANRGIFLSSGLLKFSHVFGDLFINVVKVAESSGTLPENLLYLGEELRKKELLHKRVKGALIYPIIIMIATVIIAFAMVVFVFPKILPIFENASVELPFTTRLLIDVSKILTNYGLWILLGGAALVIGFRFSLKTQAVKFIYDRMLFFVPLFGRTIVNFNMANFTRTFSLLLRSGVKIGEAIDITSLTLTNLVYRRHLRHSADLVRKGEFLSKHLGISERLFPSLLVNMIEVGENTGNLTDNLAYLAEYYENEVDDFVKNLSGILEPILLLLMGGVVGFIALSFITPIYQLTRTIK